MTRAVLSVVASALALAGCSILPESEPSDIYRLSRPASASTGITPREYGAPTVMISLPAADRSLGGNSVLVARPDGSMAVAAGVRWASPARNMVQDMIIETFESGAAGVAPLRPGDGIAGDYDLSIDLRHFEAEYDRGMEAAPLVRVALGARLISEARDLEGSTVFDASGRAEDNSMTSIVAAFNGATNQIADELAAWTVERVRAAELRTAAEEAGRPTDVSVDVDVDVND